MNKNFTHGLILFLILLSACAPAPEALATQTAGAWTPTPKPTSTQVPTATVETIPTPEPYDYKQIGLPLILDEIVEFKKNFNCPTNYGDFTHDGNDFTIYYDQKTQVIAVDDGKVVRSEYVNDNVGYEVHILLGYDENQNPIHAVYVHLTSVDFDAFVNKGDNIGYIEKPQNHLHFEIRVGTEPRMEFPNDGAPGDEIDVTEILEQYIPLELIGFDDRYGKICE